MQGRIQYINRQPVAEWGPARIVGGDVAAAFRALKAGDGPDITILGSGELVRSLAVRGLIDAFEIMIYPVAIGRGTTLFDGIAAPLEVTLVDMRVFNSGTALMNYEPRQVAG